MKTARMVVLCVATGVAASAQSSDDATIERHGDHAAIAAYTGRPLDAAATALGVGYEDPLYMFRGDMMDISAEVPRLKPDTLVPKRQKLEVEYLVDANGAPRDFGDLLQRIADQANAQSGFAYRVDRDADGYYFSSLPEVTMRRGARSKSLLYSTGQSIFRPATERFAKARS